MRRAIRSPRGDPSVGESFNPLPLPKQGEMKSLDSPCQYVFASGIRFQSAPLAEARGDVRLYDLPPHTFQCFNPLPLPKQGEMRSCFRSIRSNQQFQSAPLAEARGDLELRTGDLANDTGVSTCFNPLPLPKQGEISRRPEWLPAIKCLSNRTRGIR